MRNFKTKLAYLAGLVDGEGSITLRLQPNKQMRLRVTVYNTNEVLVDWCLVNFDGSKYKVGRRKRPDIHKQEWMWCKDGETAKDILQQIIPYLTIKQPKAKLAVEAWENRHPCKPYGLLPEIEEIREEYCEKMKGL